MYQQLENNLKLHLKSLVPRHAYAEVYDYAVFPPGKLFRPLLAITVTQDLKLSGANSFDANNNYSLFASFLELHHTYSLAHDDLPAMDNDKERRGKESLHIKYNEWQALLAGDGLINASYALLGKINSPNLGALLRYCTLCLGPRGLIQGQYLDLSGEMTKGINEVIETHFLKTARLIQCALVGPILISETKNRFTLFKRYHRLGKALGITFQLLDDLAELTVPDISPHEKLVNPWPQFFEKAQKELTCDLKMIDDFFTNEKDSKLFSLIKPYIEKNISIIEKSQKIIEAHTKKDLSPILSTLKLFTA